MTTDLVVRLRAPPKGANFVEVDEGNWAVTVYPFGELCHEAADEIERLRADLAIQTVNATAVLQAQHERDCAVEKLAELRKLLTDCADPVSCQLAEARRNLDLYKGYSSRERRYQIEIEGLERLLKAIAQPPDVSGSNSTTEK